MRVIVDIANQDKKGNIMRAFDITEEYRALEALMVEVDENGEFINSEDDLKVFIDELKDSKAEKLNNIQDFKLSNDGAISALDEKIKKLTARKTSLSKLNDRLKELQLMLLDGDKLKTDEYNFYYTTSKSVNITDESKVLERGLFTKVTRTADKAAIKKAILEGQKVLGAEIAIKKSLVIK